MLVIIYLGLHNYYDIPGVISFVFGIYIGEKLFFSDDIYIRKPLEDINDDNLHAIIKLLKKPEYNKQKEIIGDDIYSILILNVDIKEILKEKEKIVNEKKNEKKNEKDENEKDKDKTEKEKELKPKLKPSPLESIKEELPKLITKDIIDNTSKQTPLKPQKPLNPVTHRLNQTLSNAMSNTSHFKKSSIVPRISKQIVLNEMERIKSIYGTKPFMLDIIKLANERH